MIIGFTGSRNGINTKQIEQIQDFLIENKALHLHHGDCVGADKQVDQIARALGLSISIHPPDKKSLRAFCSATGEGKLHPVKPFIKRNHNIVDSCDLLIACPSAATEVQRSGTWATIRYARKNNKRVTIIDGGKQ